MSPVQEWRVPVEGESTSAVYEPAEGAQSAVFVCAHGAGGNMHDRGLQRVTQALRSVGLGVVRFNFLYREKKSARPDPMPRLMECVSAVVEHTRRELGKGTLVIGGRSMGGRAASMLASEGFDAGGLLLLAYPLHPAGRPEKLRDQHLPAIRMPAICFSGTRDPLCRQDLMEAALEKVGRNWTMHWLEGADHSFHVLKSSGRTDADVLKEVADASASWLRTVGG
ncbi:MAG TPA: alpha/beta family hydrolase [Gemmatimonadaceae bacterium]|nr:alpha/beta family hydrolase [Gemmatimonadaceae bacterium]